MILKAEFLYSVRIWKAIGISSVCICCPHPSFLQLKHFSPLRFPLQEATLPGCSAAHHESIQPLKGSATYFFFSMRPCYDQKQHQLHTVIIRVTRSVEAASQQT